MCSERQNRSLVEVAALRALAHPTRLALLDLLRESPRLTASQCAQALELSPKTCSYHLHALGRQGLIREVGHHGRERFWSRAYDQANWTEPTDVDPELHAAKVRLLEAQLRRTQQLLGTYLASSETEPLAWRKAETVLNWTAWLTPAELADWREQVDKVTSDIVRRSAGRRHPVSARRVRLAALGFPMPDAADSRTGPEE